MNASGKTELRVNEAIRTSPVRLVKADGELVGVVEVEDARRLAQESQLDLVEVSPHTKPPVCKIMDYGKYKFEQKNKNKQKRTVSSGGLKEIRCRLKIDDGDFRIKAAQGRRFLSAGNRLQVTLTLFGREATRKELAVDIVNRFRDFLTDVSKVEREAKPDGRRITMILCPKKK